MKPLVIAIAPGSPENNFTVFPLVGKPDIAQNNDSTTTLPERTADTFPPFIETCSVKESCTGDTEYLRSHKLPLEAALDRLAYVLPGAQVVPVCGRDR